MGRGRGEGGREVERWGGRSEERGVESGGVGKGFSSGFSATAARVMQPAAVISSGDERPSQQRPSQLEDEHREFERCRANECRLEQTGGSETSIAGAERA